MQKLLIAGIIILAAAGTATAKQEGIPNLYYMALDLTTGKCVMMATAPTSSRYKLMGTYTTKRAVSRAMRNTAECQA